MAATKTTCLLIAEAMQAVDYLERAEAWAADVDEEIVKDMIRIHDRLLRRIRTLRANRMAERRIGPDRTAASAPAPAGT